jgi:hypothetical protein
MLKQTSEKVHKSEVNSLQTYLRTGVLNSVHLFAPVRRELNGKIDNARVSHATGEVILIV